MRRRVARFNERLDAVISWQRGTPLYAILRIDTVRAGGGLSRNQLELGQGYSFATALWITVAGVAFLLVARSAPQIVERGRSLTVLGLVASVGMVGLSALYLTLLPVIFFTISSVLFALALWSRRTVRSADLGSVEVAASSDGTDHEPA